MCMSEPVLPAGLGEPWFRLPPEHPLQVLVLEQEELLRLADRLAAVDAQLQERPTDQPEHLLDLLCLVHYLGRAEPHRRKKLEALLPELEAAGAQLLASRVRESEQWLASAREDLRRLAAEQDPMPREARRATVHRMTRALVAGLREQITFEQEEVFPRALARLDRDAWERIAFKAAGIGSCLGRLEPRAAAG